MIVNVKCKIDLRLPLVGLLLSLCLPSWSASGYADLIEMDYSGKADTLTTVLIRQFLNSSKGTFWAVPRDQSDRNSKSTYIYWQQAHAMDVVVYSYQRIKEKDPTLAATYAQYMELWYKYHANNWYHDASDDTGFLNEYTDDMCWIALTLLHMSEALGDEKFAETACLMFDEYIAPRGWTDADGFWGLPWTSKVNDRNACTNAPGCLVACKLYQLYGDEKYLDMAKKMYDYLLNVMKTNLNNDGRVEEPPLTYTQGTFGEACRQLYHITGEKVYMQTAQRVIYYVCTSGRCVDRGILRHEGTSMDQSIFKAVAIPYIVNMTLDENVTRTYRQLFIKFLQTNAKTLWENLDLQNYPRTYCNYYWAEPVDNTQVPSMGAMASGASLMENVARMALQLTSEDTGVEVPAGNVAGRSGMVYGIDGRAAGAVGINMQDLPRGIYVIDNKKILKR